MLLNYFLKHITKYTIVLINAAKKNYIKMKMPQKVSNYLEHVHSPAFFL